jgi:hypothetical protein
VHFAVKAKCQFNLPSTKLILKGADLQRTADKPQIKKLWHRASLISTSAVYRISSSLFNLGISILIIRLLSAGIWDK